MEVIEGYHELKYCSVGSGICCYSCSLHEHWP